MRRILKYLLIFPVAGITLILLIALTKALLVYSIYSFFLVNISSLFGLDLMPSRAIAILATTCSVLLFPFSHLARVVGSIFNLFARSFQDSPSARR
jgi:hypothetical protein